MYLQLQSATNLFMYLQLQSATYLFMYKACNKIRHCLSKKLTLFFIQLILKVTREEEEDQQQQQQQQQQQDEIIFKLSCTSSKLVPKLGFKYTFILFVKK